MNDIRFKLKKSGVRQLLRSKEMQDVLSKCAGNIKLRAGEGYEMDTYVGRNRANAMVYANTYQAKSDNSKNNTLLKAIR